MKVQELIQDLLLADPNAEVWLAVDAEGNGFRPLSGGDPYDSAYVTEDGELSFDNEELWYDGDPNAIVLWPV